MINEDMLSGCSSLKKVNFGGSKELWSAIFFRGVIDEGTPDYTIYCSNGTLSKRPTFDRAADFSWEVIDETLFIRGNGALPEFGDSGPWEEYVEQIRKIVVGNGIKSISEQAFRSCNKAEKIELASSVVCIDYYAFYGMYNLKEVEIPASVSYISPLAFVRSLNVELDIDENNPYYLYDDGAVYNKDKTVLYFVINAKYDSKNSSGAFTVPDTVKNIGSYAFALNDSITSVQIPQSVTTIGAGAFYRCNITSVVLPNGLKCISQGMFTESQISTLIIPEGVTAIQDNAFSKAPATQIILPSSLKFIGERAFRECKLTNITLPNSVVFVGDEAFASSSLASITFSNKMTGISRGTFDGCSSLVSVTIPKNIVSICQEVFGCKSLTDVKFEDPDGWYVTETVGATSGTNVTLTNQSTAATYLKEKYSDYYWYKK
jgi:hypothetical protein